MPVKYIETDPSVTPLTYVVDHTLFTAQNQAVLLSTAPHLPTGTRILGVVIHKELSFNDNTISFGTGVTTALHSNIADATEVSATATGIVEPAAWKAAGGFADLFLSTGNRPIYARLGSGGLPTAGLIRLTLLTWRLPERTTY